MSIVSWYGDVKPEDDFGDPIVTTFYDGATTFGPWAIMTPKSFRKYGVGVGQGKGQRYERQSNKKWQKVEG